MQGRWRPPRRALALGALVLSLGAGAGVAEAAMPMPTPAHAKLVLRSSHYGKVIFAGNGDAVYTFGPDKHGVSTCYGACAKAWPPVLTKGTPAVAAGLDRMLLGTTKRRDGTLQVTYNHHPLYFYSADMHGKIMCQHVVMHGGLWLVLEANGKPSMMKGTGM
jgi:predicted lipoprotein with Yx(FWY)xxD motif